MTDVGVTRLVSIERERLAGAKGIDISPPYRVELDRAGLEARSSLAWRQQEFIERTHRAIVQERRGCPDTVQRPGLVGQRRKVLRFLGQRVSVIQPLAFRRFERDQGKAFERRLGRRRLHVEKVQQSEFQ